MSSLYIPAPRLAAELSSSHPLHEVAYVKGTTMPSERILLLRVFVTLVVALHVNGDRGEREDPAQPHMMTSARRRFMGNADGHFPGDDGGVAKAAAAIASPVALESSSPSWQPSEWRAFLLGALAPASLSRFRRRGSSLPFEGWQVASALGVKTFSGWHQFDHFFCDDDDDVTSVLQGCVAAADELLQHADEAGTADWCG
eukprot:CAMPEP_0198690504 /NCGR_PEP_ID=MMETSP1468-20131203/176899_1 /TAXON_ID=1461545 /ORGANISM="Mantoniella sp, Strain CCMP1436" /LENGTH=199 /DNA_ID=CAMNT_0044442771 /DNA_START=178 /DNA_END=779 /DNA_ORIENTATION=+